MEEEPQPPCEQCAYTYKPLSNYVLVVVKDRQQKALTRLYLSDRRPQSFVSLQLCVSYRIFFKRLFVDFQWFFFICLSFIPFLLCDIKHE